MDSLINLLKMGLDGSSARHNAISNNIANVDTPNYKRRDVEFISLLKSKLESGEKLPLKRTDNRHLSGSIINKPFKEIVSDRTKYRNDGNNVDIDYEMAQLAKNNIYYNTLVQLTGERFKMYKDVIQKGSR